MHDIDPTTNQPSTLAPRSANSAGSVEASPSRIRPSFLTLLVLLAIGVGMLFPRPVRADDPEAAFTFAEGLFNRQYYSLAVEKYRSYLSQEPDGPHAGEASFKLGECYYALKDWGRAVGSYDDFLGKNPTGASRGAAEVHEGDCELNLNDPGAGAAAFRKGLQDSHDPHLSEHAAYWLGESLLESKDYAGAIKAYDTLITRYPQSDQLPAALTSRGECQLALGQNAAAAESFRAVLDRFPHAKSASEAALRLGDALYAAKDYAGAAAAYTRVRTDYGTSDFVSDAADGLAWALMKQEKYAEAAPLFEQTAAAHPDQKQGQEAALQAGICYVRLNNLDKAQAVLSPLSQDENSSYGAEAGYLLGRTLLEAKQYAPASTAFHTFLQLHPNDSRAPYAWAGLGAAAAARNQYADAAEAYGQASKSLTDPKLKLDVLTGLLWADGKLGRTADAAATRAIILREYPNSPVAADSELASADRAWDAKDYGAALAAYGQFIAQHPTGADTFRAMYRVELCKIKLGRLEDAAATFSSLAAKDPHSSFLPDGALALADARFQAKNYSGASALYTRIIGSYGTSSAVPMALYGRASARVLTSDLDGAYADFSRLAAEYPKDLNAPEASFRLGWVREKQGQKAAAAADYQKTIDAFPQGSFTAEAGFRRGAVLASLDQPDQAAAAWDAAAQSFPDSPFAPQALTSEGWTLVDARKPTGAMAAFQKVVDRYASSPQGAEATAELATLKMEQGDLDGAEHLFSQFEQQYPHDPLADRAAYGEALVKYKQGKYADAGAAFEAASTNFPTSKLKPEAEFWAGESYLKAQQFDRALADYKSYLESYGTGAHAAAAALGAGQCEQHAQLWDAAIAHYKQAADLDAAHFGARASCYAGECLLAQHRDADAVEKLLKVIVLYSDDPVAPEAQFRLGQAYEEQKDLDRAKDAYTKVAAMPNAGDWSDQARQRLAALKQ